MHTLWIARSSFRPMPAEGKLINQVKVDWIRQARLKNIMKGTKDDRRAFLPVWMWAKSSASAKTPAKQEDSDKEEDK